MAVRKYKPRTAGMRGTVIPLYKRLLSGKGGPFRSLVKGVHRAVGRNSAGRITMRHRGGGHKRRYRAVDFLQNKIDMPAKVETVEYDPNRTSFISLICYGDGERRYVLTPAEVKAGDTILTSEKAPLKPGNRMPLKNIPVGTAVYNIELKKHGGAKIARSAGVAATLLGHDGVFAHIKMPSQEVRKVPVSCFASVGSVGNREHHLRVVGKAGRKRWMGRRPTVRGNAMNPVDHPHGGGEGRQGRGRRRAVTKWGKPSGKGQKTRGPKKYSDAHIVRRRQVAKKKR